MMLTRARDAEDDAMTDGCGKLSTKKAELLLMMECRASLQSAAKNDFVLMYGSVFLELVNNSVYVQDDF